MRRKNLFFDVKGLAFSTAFFLLLFFLLFPALIKVHAQSSTSVPSTIFSDTSVATFTITTSGPIGNISYSVTDLSHSLVKSGTSGVSGQQTLLTLPTLPDGYYTLNVFDHTQQSAPQQHISFAVLAPPPAAETDSPFGVGIHLGGADGSTIAPLITQLGVKSVRSDLTWSQVEQVPGQYSFNGYDSALQVFQQDHLNPLLILDYNNRFYDHGQTPYDNAGLSAFARYAQAVVLHYGSQLKAVEIYNEYNGLFSTGPCARKPACYARMLQYSYQAIKSVRPDVTVVGGAVFAADLPWFAQVFQNGGLRYMDAVSDHPYPLINVLSPERAAFAPALQALQLLIKFYNAGVSKPLWITELGWPTSFLSVNEQMQAQYLVRGAVLSLAAGAQKFFWYDCLNDGTNPYLSEQNFGLLHRPDAAGRYTPKPSFVAYATLIRQLAHQSFLGGGSIGNGVYDEHFSTVRVLWTTGSDQQITIPTSRPLLMTTMTGKTSIYTPVSGQIILPLSEDPIYLSTNTLSLGIEVR